MRRKAKFAIILGLGALFLALVLIHSSPAKALVRQVLSWAMVSTYGGEFGASQLDYRLWKGEFLLEDLRFAPETEMLPLRLSARKVEVAVSPRKGVSLVVFGPDLTWLMDESREERTKAPSRVSLPSWLERLEISEGDLHVIQTEKPWLDAASIELNLARHRGTYRGRVRISDVGVQLIDRRIYAGPLEAHLDIEEETLRLRELRIEKDASLARIQGAITSLSPLFATLRGEFQADAEILRELEPRIEATGTISGEYDLELDPDGQRVRARVQSEALSWGALGPWALDAQARLDNGRFELSRLVLDGYGGELRARLETDEAAQSIQATFSNLDLPLMITDWNKQPLPIESRASGEFRVVTSDWDPNRAEGEGHIVLTPARRRREIPLRGRLDLTLQSGTAHFRAEKLLLPHTELGFRGEVTMDGKLRVAYRAQLENLAEIASLLHSLDLAPAPGTVDGQVVAVGQAAGAFPDVSWSLELNSSNLLVHQERFELHSSLRVAADRLDIQSFSLRGKRGILAARGAIPLRAEAGPWDFSGSLEEADLSWLLGERDLSIPAVAKGEFEVFGPFRDPDFTAALRGSHPRLIYGAEGEFHVNVRKHGRFLSLDALEARLGSAWLRASGSYGLDSRHLTASLRGEGLRVSELPQITEILGGLNAVVSDLEVDVDGPVDAPRGKGRLNLRETSLRGAALPDLSIAADSNGSTLQLEARLANGRLLASSQCLLESPYPVTTNIDLAAFPFDSVTQVFPSLAQAQARLQAKGRAEISLSVSDLERVRYLVHVDEFAGSYLGMGGGAGSPFVLEGDLESLEIRDLNVVGTNTAIAVEGRIPFSPDATLELHTKGNLQLELLNLVLPASQISGRAAFDLRFAGTWSHPRLQGDLEIDEGGLGWQSFRAQQVTARVEAAEGSVYLRELRGRALAGSFRTEGEFPLPAPTPERPARLNFFVDGVDLAELLPTEEDSTTDVSIRISLAGRLEAPGIEAVSLRGRGELQKIQAGLGDVNLENEDPVTWQLEKLALALPRVHLVGGRSSLTVQMQADLSTDELVWRSTIKGSVDTAILNPVLSVAGGPVLSGMTEVDVEVSGGPEGPRFSGNGSLDGLRLVLRDPPLVISNIRGEARFQDQSLTLAGLTAEAGGGSLEGSGIVELAGPRTRSVAIQLDAQSIRLEYPEGLRGDVSGSVRLTGDGERFRLSGDVLLLQAILSRNITLQTELLNALRREAAGLLAEESFLESIELDLRVRTEDDMRIDNNLARMQASVNLRLGGSLAMPEVDGVIIAQPEGTLRFGGNVYQIESARILLSGYPSGPPELDVTAQTTVSGIEIVLQTQGTTDNLTMSLTAPDEPDLTRADIASLLITGRTLDRIPSGQEFVREQVSSYLTGTLSGIAQQELAEVLPFDQVSVDPGRIGSEVDPGLRFNLGKAITQDLFLTYSVSLDNTQSQLWILDYELARGISLRGVRKEDNKFAGAISQRLHLNLRDRPRERRRDARSRIGSVRFEGELPGLDDRDLRKNTGLSIGDPYDYWSSQEAASRLRNAFRGEGYLNAVVEARALPTKEQEVDLVFHIEAGDPVELHWEGDDPGSRIRRDVERGWDGRFPEGILIAELAAEAQRALKSERYYQATVTPSASDTDDGGRRITFTVDKGPRGKRVVLTFDGNHALSRDALASALPSRSSAEFFDMISEQTGRLRESLRVLYGSQGYLDVKIGEPRTRYEEQSGELHVILPIEEGPASTISRMSFEGANSFPEARLRSQLRLREGRLFSLSDFIHDRGALATFYRREGFSSVRVASRFERDGAGLALTYAVEEGPQARVGSIRVVGNQATAESTILRELTFKKGDPVRISDLTESQNRLYDLGIFRSADVRVESSESLEKEVLIEVTETADLVVNYGLRYEADSGLEILTELNVPNLFGGAQHGGVTTRWKSTESLVRLTFHTPYLSRYAIDTDFFVSRETDEEDFADTRTWSFTFQQTRSLKDRLSAQWSYTFKRDRNIGKVLTGPFAFDFSINRVLLTASLIEDTRDNVLQPSHGRFWNLTFQVAPEALGSDIKFVKVFGRLYAFLPIGKGLIWASGYRMGVAQGFGQLLREDDRFKAGGATSVRGFAQDSLGPVEPVTGTNIGGESFAVFNQELRFPIYWWFSGVTFYDAGNVFLNIEDFNPFDLRHSAGIGLRVEAPFGLLRLDWARVLDRQAGEKASRLFFSFGHAF